MILCDRVKSTNTTFILSQGTSMQAQFEEHYNLYSLICVYIYSLGSTVDSYANTTYISTDRNTVTVTATDIDIYINSIIHKNTR